MPRKISDEAGATALGKIQAGTGTDTEKILAVRYTLQQLAQDYPGRAVEVRVPPAGAVQILEGVTHRRGTPPAVVETDVDTWLSLVTGKLGWDQACATGRVLASGQRTDLSGVIHNLASQGI